MLFNPRKKNMKKFKVLDPHGVTGFNGRQYAQGDIVTEEPEAHIKAWLRFGQVEEVTEKAKGPKGKPSKETSEKEAPTTGEAE